MDCEGLFGYRVGGVKRQASKGSFGFSDRERGEKDGRVGRVARSCAGQKIFIFIQSNYCTLRHFFVCPVKLATVLFFCYSADIISATFGNEFFISSAKIKKKK